MYSPDIISNNFELFYLAAARCAAGDVMDDIFSAPKVQIARVVGKFLGNCPLAAETEVDCLRHMSEVVSALACFGEHICGQGKGTAIESAEQVAFHILLWGH